MRVRSKHSPPVSFQHCTILESSGNIVVNPTVYSGPVSLTSESMIDDPSNGLVDKTCYHTKREATSPETLEFIIQGNWENPPYDPRKDTWVGQFCSTMFPEIELVPDSFDLDKVHGQFRVQFFHQVLNGFKQRALLPNFVRELREMRRLHGLWRKPLQRFMEAAKRDHRDRIQRERRGRAGKFRLKPRIKEAAKDWADAQLGLAFGMLPFVSDVKNLFDMVQGIDDEVRHLRRNNGQKVVIADMASVTMPSADSGLLHIGPGPYVHHKGVYRVNRAMSSGVLRGKAILDYDLGGMTDFELATRSLSSQSGLNNPLGVIWEAVPFSFIVDWFADVGTFLQRHVSFNLSPPCRVRRFSTSIKMSILYTVDVGFGTSYLHPNVDFVGILEHSQAIHRTHYHRIGGWEAGEESLGDYLSRPGSDKLVLAIALALQRK